MFIGNTLTLWPGRRLHVQEVICVKVCEDSRWTQNVGARQEADPIKITEFIPNKSKQGSGPGRNKSKTQTVHERKQWWITRDRWYRTNRWNTSRQEVNGTETGRSDFQNKTGKTVEHKSKQNGTQKQVWKQGNTDQITKSVHNKNSPQKPNILYPRVKSPESCQYVTIWYTIRCNYTK